MIPTKESLMEKSFYIALVAPPPPRVEYVGSRPFRDKSGLTASGTGPAIAMNGFPVVGKRRVRAMSGGRIAGKRMVTTGDKVLVIGRRGASTNMCVMKTVVTIGTDDKGLCES